jgi:ribosome-associated protein
MDALYNVSHPAARRSRKDHSMPSDPPSIDIPIEEFEFTYARSGGPGGQNVNKVNSKAILRWSVTTSPSLPEAVRQRFLQKFSSRLTIEGELIITSQKYRDQARNVEDCMTKLQEMIASVAAAPIIRRKTKPTRASVERRVDSKKKTSAKKSQRRSPVEY